MGFLDNILSSLQTGFIDRDFPSEYLYRPQLLINEPEKNKRVLSTLLSELNDLSDPANDGFYFSVAFVTTSGLQSIKQALVELEEKGVNGKILASQYLNFTQPEALRQILEFKNIELRIATSGDFHNKGYIFKKENHYNLIIGSSNLTANALSSNKEWNLKVSATNNSDLVHQTILEFEASFHSATQVDTAFIEHYRLIYNREKTFRSKLAHIRGEEPAELPIPNKMQEIALQNLNSLRQKGQTKGLLISATGTGKTYLSAFDAKQFSAKKLLFVVHRRTIAEKSMQSFKALFGDAVRMGLYSGNERELDADFIFCTVQTLAKDEHLHRFQKNHFDYIVIDETHRAAAKSYDRILQHFVPKFLLGMTATPERTDEKDVFELFDYNIAYEIRLQEALKEDILCPFHYFGIGEIEVDGILLDDKADFNLLMSEQRVEHILETIQKYGSDNGIVRGLVFCSKKEECHFLAQEFNKRNLVSIALTGDNNEDERRKSIQRLESTSYTDKIDYIFTVDIFNEGVDIPRVNQVVMLRPTQSAIIFVQQLGRGLRKAENKDFLTVIDFIGNYSNNFLVPIALFGDASYNKDTLRKLISVGSEAIPGTSTVNFDIIAKKQIFKAIDNSNLQLKKDLIDDYKRLKNKLGRMPMMCDFLDTKSRDPKSYVEYAKSYFSFIQLIETELQSQLSTQQKELLALFSQEIANGKRSEEAALLKLLIEKNNCTETELKSVISEKYGYPVSKKTLDSLERNLNFTFVGKAQNILIKANETFQLSADFRKEIANEVFVKFLQDVLNYATRKFDSIFNLNLFQNGFVIGAKYSRKDVCRILNWEKDISSTVYGYRTQNKQTPCFVTYRKSEGISLGTQYNDHFINPQTFAWESRSNRKIDSAEIQNVIHSELILLFIKKSDGEGTDFYCLGEVSIVENSIVQAQMPKSGEPVVHFKYQIKNRVEENLYKYLTSE
jgi:superfamily II DNA or RNA helicase/HKD family nuclease